MMDIAVQSNVTVGNGCEGCSHQHVCRYSSAMEELNVEINNAVKGKNKEGNPFNAYVVCTYYESKSYTSVKGNISCIQDIDDAIHLNLTESNPEPTDIIVTNVIGVKGGTIGSP